MPLQLKVNEHPIGLYSRCLVFVAKYYSEGMSILDISVALGGGGARGIAHLGVLLALEEYGYRVRAIAGTSAGGIIAAIYAAGYSPAEILARFIEVDQSALYGRRQGDSPSILGVAGINQILQEMLGDRTFEELKIPCALTAVNLETEEEVILRRGRVVDAVLATIALPGIFPPQLWEGYHLVDGGLLDPVPVLPARNLAPHLPVVAVVLTSISPQPGSILDPPKIVGSNPLLREIARLRIGQAFNIFLRSIAIGSRYLTLLRLQIDRPEVVINPELLEIGILDRVDILDLAMRGRLAVEDAISELEKEKRWTRRLGRIFIGNSSRTHRL